MQQADLGEAVGTQNLQGVFPSIIIVSLDYMSRSYSLHHHHHQSVRLMLTWERRRTAVEWVCLEETSATQCVCVSATTDRLPFTRLEIVMKLLQSSPSSLSAVSDSLVQHLYCSAFQPSANSLLRPTVRLICSLKSWWSRLVTSCENTKSWRVFLLDEWITSLPALYNRSIRKNSWLLSSTNCKCWCWELSGSPLNLSAMLAEPVTCQQNLHTSTYYS